MRNNNQKREDLNKQLSMELAAFKKAHKSLSKKTLLNILFYQLMKLQALEKKYGQESNNVQLSPSENLENKDESV